jgi:hypothetical protein
MATCPPSLQVVRRFFFLSSLPERKGAVSVLWEDEVVMWESNESETEGREGLEPYISERGVR